MPFTGKHPTRAARRVLEPEERIAEVLFGLIMVLTFTGSLSVAGAGRDDVRAMIVGALGCNFAWGVIDGILYLLSCVADRGRNLKILRAVRSARESAEAERSIAGALPPLLASVLEPADLATMRQRLLLLPEPPQVARVTSRDLFGAVGVFLLVTASTLPVAVPFVMVRDVASAMRLSNAVALLMLLLTGVAYGRAVGRSMWAFGLGMVALGAALVALTIALGG